MPHTRMNESSNEIPSLYEITVRTIHILVVSTVVVLKKLFDSYKEQICLMRTSISPLCAIDMENYFLDRMTKIDVIR